MIKFKPPRYFSDWRVDKYGNVIRSPKKQGRSSQACAILQGAEDYKLKWKYVYDRSSTNNLADTTDTQ